MPTFLKVPMAFDGFGPSMLTSPTRGRLQQIEISTDRRNSRKTLRQVCPLVPGVYGWLNENRQLVYVGKSKSLQKRLLSYFVRTDSDSKMDRIRQQSRSLVWEPISHELLALIREQELIHRWRPEFNSMGQPTRMKPAFVCIQGQPAPNARMAYRLTGKWMQAFGPIMGTGRLREAVECLNQAFRLRDCADQTKFRFQNQMVLFDDPQSANCIRHELGSCPGPCAGLCNSGTYQQNLEKAVQFLTGENLCVLDQLQQQMTAAAKKHQFEMAAVYRDRWRNLAWLDRQLATLRTACQQLTGVLPIESRRRKQTTWLVLRSGRIVLSMLAPDSPESARSTQADLTRIAAASCSLPTDLLDISTQLIVMSWFRKYPEMQIRLIGFPAAMEFCEAVQRGSQAVPSSSRKLRRTG